MFERLMLSLMLGLPVAAAFLIPVIGGPQERAGSLAGLERIPCCAFRHFTGIPCPLCGLTRSFVSTARGEIRRAFLYNLLGPPLFVLFSAVSAWSLGAAVTSRLRARDPSSAARQEHRQDGRVALIVAILFLAAWAVKLAFVPREFW